VDPEISDLEFPIQDAQNIMQVLTTEYIFKEENVLLLKNPDRKEIINKLIELKNKLNSDDNLLIYYSGHGHYDEDAKQGYWLPRNANASDPSNWLSNSDIRDRIRTIKTKHTLLITDACFSGAIFEVREAIKPNFSIMELYKRPSRQAITSGNKNTVPDKSVFVEYLMKTLKSNKEKYLTTIELYSRLREPVINNSPVHQTPLHGVILETGDENGDFIFTRR